MNVHVSLISLYLFFCYSIRDHVSSWYSTRVYCTCPPLVDRTCSTCLSIYIHLCGQHTWPCLPDGTAYVSMSPWWYITRVYVSLCVQLRCLCDSVGTAHTCLCGPAGTPRVSMCPLRWYISTVYVSLLVHDLCTSITTGTPKDPPEYTHIMYLGTETTAKRFLAPCRNM